MLHPSRKKQTKTPYFIHPPQKKTIIKTTRHSPSPIRRRLSLLHDTLPLHHHLDQPLESFWPPAADLDLTVLVAAEDPNQPVQVSPGRIVEIQRTEGARNLQLTVRFLPGKLRAGMVDTWPDHYKHISVFFLCFCLSSVGMRRKGFVVKGWSGRVDLIWMCFCFAVFFQKKNIAILVIRDGTFLIRRDLFFVCGEMDLCDEIGLDEAITSIFFGWNVHGWDDGNDLKRNCRHSTRQDQR